MQSKTTAHASLARLEQEKAARLASAAAAQTPLLLRLADYMLADMVVCSVDEQLSLLRQALERSGLISAAVSFTQEGYEAQPDAGTVGLAVSKQVRVICLVGAKRQGAANCS
jgi:hypothetical protein